jgi:hypothetical protein
MPDWVVQTGTVAGGDSDSASAPLMTAAAPAASSPHSSFHCPTFGTAQSAYSTVALEESYGARTDCLCDANYFGRDGQCMRCPGGCSCSGDLVQGCWPVIRQGSVTVGGGRSNDSDSSGGGSSRADSADSAAHPGATIAPFRLLGMLPCARSETGASLCNPDGISWRHFYSGLQRDHAQAGVADACESAAAISSSLTLSESGSAFAAPALDLSGWCSAGRAGRLCSACASGWFRSGRGCARCLGSGAHAAIVLAHLAALLVLVAALYLRTPGAEAARKGLQQYARLFRLQAVQPTGMHTATGRLADVAEDDPADDAADAAAVAPVATLPAAPRRRAADAAQWHAFPPAASAADSAAADSATPAPVADAASPDAVAPSASPLRLLLFHVQQLGLLLATSAALPASLGAFLGVASAGGSAFAPSALLAAECLLGAERWGLREQCWAALLAPAAVAAAAGAAWMHDRRQRRRAGELGCDGSASAFDSSGNGAAPDPSDSALSSAGHSGPSAPSPAHASSSSSSSSRVYGTCVGVLYLLVLPCAQTALAALSCTDLREASAGSDSDPDAADSAYDSDSGGAYLNLHPWQRCSAQWRREVLPPALLGALLWCAAFPVASTLLLRRMQRRVSAAMLVQQPSHAKAESAGRRVDASGAFRPSSSRDDTVSLFSSSSAAAAAASASASSSASAAAASASAHSAWSLCGLLLSPFSPRLWYWEQALLLRRLLLVGAVAAIPAHSLYLPLALLSLVQLAALLQHWARPYAHSWLNRAELASLYLLQINYITALVLQSAGAGAGAGAAGAAADGVSGGGGQGAAAWTALLLVANLLFLLALVAALFAFARQAAAGILGRARTSLRPLLARLGLDGGLGGECDAAESSSLQAVHGQPQSSRQLGLLGSSIGVELGGSDSADSGAPSDSADGALSLCRSGTAGRSFVQYARSASALTLLLGGASASAPRSTPLQSHAHSHSHSHLPARSPPSVGVQMELRESLLADDRVELG